MIKCPKCSKEFKNEVALRMHDMRSHTGIIKTPGQLAIAGGKRFKQPWTTQPKKPQRGGVFPSWSKEQIDLLFAIESQYRDNGTNINWKRAFREHPEWLEDLDNRSIMAISGRLNYAKAMQAKRAKREQGLQQTSTDAQVVQTRPRSIQGALKANPVPQQNGHGVSFCPDCGCEIRIWNHVASVVQNLKQKANQ